MKVAIVTDIFTQLSGISTHVQSLAEALAKKYDVTVYTGSGKSTGKYRVENQLFRFPFPLNTEYEVILPTKLRFTEDIVHVHTPYTLGWRAIFSTKPKVATTHTLPKNLFPSGFAANLCWNFLFSFYNRADHVICQTNSTRLLFQSHGLRKPVSVISAGVEYDFFSNGNAKRFRDKYGIDDDFVLTTSRLSAEKRPGWSLKACDELRIKIVLTSDGPMRKELEAQYPGAVFLGKISKEDLRDAYAAAKIFVLPSAEEGEGISILEAMAAGTPVICTSLPCIADFIADSVNGYLFSDFTEFKKKLYELWKDKTLRNTFAKKGRKTAKERDIHKSANLVANLYERLISEK